MGQSKRPLAAGPRLIGIRGPLSGRVVHIDAPLTQLGRDGANDIVIRDSSVSRRHCLLRREGERIRLVDVGSRHGIHVNGVRAESHLLSSEDRIVLGRSAFVFLDSEDSARAAEVTLELSEEPAALGESRSLRVEDGLYARPQAVLAEAGAPRAAAGLETLRRVATALHSLREPEPLAGRLLELLFAAVPASRGGILIFAAGTTAGIPDPEIAAVYTWGREIGEERRARLSRTILRRVLVERVAVLANGVHEAAAFSAVTSLQEAHVRSLLCVPIALYERVVGLLYLDSSDPGSRFDEAHLELASAVAAMAAMPLAAAHEAGEHGPGAAEGRRSAASASDPSGSTGSFPVLAPAAASSPLPASESTAAAEAIVAVVFRPAQRLDLSTALFLLGALAQVPAERYPRVVLFLDFGGGAGTDPARLPDPWLDRLAVLPAVPQLLVRATSVPSIARLATMVASMISAGEAATDARSWFQEVLLGSALVLTRASWAALEPGAPADAGTPAVDPAAELALARDLGSRLNKAFPGMCQRPSPLVAAFSDFLPLDGRPTTVKGTARGTLYVDDPPDVVARKIRSARTDGRPAFDPAAGISPEVRGLLLLLNAVTGEPTDRSLSRLAGKGYGALKDELVEGVNAFLEPVRRRRAELGDGAEMQAAIAAGSAVLDRTGRALLELVEHAPGVVR